MYHQFNNFKNRLRKSSHLSLNKMRTKLITMKKILLLTTVLSVASLYANTTIPTPEKENYAASNAYKKIQLDYTIKDVNGTSWHIYGWVDVSIGLGGISINHYDVHLVGGGNHYHFVGKMATQGNGSTDIDGLLEDVINKKTIDIDGDMKTLLIQINDDVIKNNS